MNKEIKSKIIVREYTVSNRRIVKPLRLVFLSDYHEARFRPYNRPLIDLVDSLCPDAVLIGGDMIISAKVRPGNRKWYRWSRLLFRHLCRRYPVFAGEGNHETRLRYLRDLQPCYEEYCNMVRNEGANLLLNEWADFSGIRIYGLSPDGDAYRRFRLNRLDKEEVSFLLQSEKAPEDRFSLVLAHHPSFFRACAAWGADLTLSGHLHGGIVRFGNRGAVSSDPSIFPKYSGGIYDAPFNPGQKLIVSCGVGTHTIPLRINNPPEVTLIQLEPDS